MDLLSGYGDGGDSPPPSAAPTLLPRRAGSSSSASGGAAASLGAQLAYSRPPDVAGALPLASSGAPTAGAARAAAGPRTVPAKGTGTIAGATQWHAGVDITVFEAQSRAFASRG